MPILLVDGHNLAHRQYHQPMLKDLTRADGKPSGMFVGCLTAVQKLLVRFQPSQVIVVFDGIGASERRQAQYAGYKSRRHAALTGAFRRQLKAVKASLASLGIVLVERPGVEADDLLFHLGKVAETTTIIISSDRDMLQCVTDDVWVYDEGRRFMWTLAMVLAKYQLAPGDIPLLKALEGDLSDGVKGVPGIGRVRGTEIIHRYKTAAKIRDHLTEDQQEAFVRSLAVVQLTEDPTLKEVALLHIESAKPYQPDLAKLSLAQYNCESIIRKFDTWALPFKQLAAGKMKVHA